NYPNPFNPVTTIAFNVPKASTVTAEIYNLKGQKVKTLVHGFLSTGSHQYSWNGTNDNGKTVGSGVYFCTIKGDSFHSVHKMVMLK
ncbi:MAG TPA: FlgD immunoglobulin-like domain containing protein, partial [Candidatus Cloacimonadota bacterium]|nr:FlgD immunoglobulin-like domain containing protein [Candidatus Cloacimonadota bacterium]